MRTEKYFDVGCDWCGHHLSTDFGRGMAETALQAVRWAKEEGFHEVNGETLCKHCYELYKSKNKGKEGTKNGC